MLENVFCLHTFVLYSTHLWLVAEHIEFVLLIVGASYFQFHAVNNVRYSLKWAFSRYIIVTIIKVDLLEHVLVSNEHIKMVGTTSHSYLLQYGLKLINDVVYSCS